MDNFVLYSKNNHNTVTLKPFTYLTPSIRTTTIWSLALLGVQLVLLGLSGSYSSLIVIACSLAGAVFADVVFSLISKQTTSISWMITIEQGIVIGLLLPESYFPVAVFIITVVSLMLNKYAFGGFATSWANPVALTVALCYFLDMTVFPSYGLTMESLQIRNPALSMIQDGVFKTYSFDTPITDFLNKTVFSLFGVNVPSGYVSLFWDNGAAIPAFRFNFVTLVSSIILISFDMIDIIIPLCFVTVYSLLVKFVSPVMIGGLPYQGDIILALLTSGTLFCTLFVLQWYGTTPVTRIGKVVYGLLSGIIGFLILGCGTSPIGYVFIVLIMNTISPLIHVIESKNTRSMIERQLLPRLNIMKGGENV